MVGSVAAARAGVRWRGYADWKIWVMLLSRRRRVGRAVGGASGSEEASSFWEYLG